MVEIIPMNNFKTGRQPPKRVDRTGHRLRPSIIFTSSTTRDNLFFTMRARLIVLFVFVTIVPLALLSIFNLNNTRNALTRAANERLLMAASETAAEVDTFIRNNSYAIQDEAKVEEFIDLLSLLPEEREGSAQEEKAIVIMQSLYSKQRVLNPYMEAYWLLDRNGSVVLTNSTNLTEITASHLGLNDADPYAYNLMINTGEVYVSPIIVSGVGNQEYLFYASRVIDKEGHTIGVIAAQYNAEALQAIVEKKNRQAGEASYAVLYDENFVRLAHGINPDLILKSVVPLESSSLALLQATGRLPFLPEEDLSTNIPSLAEGLASAYASQPFFSTEPESEGGEIQSGAISQLQTRTWMVAFMQPESVFLQPVTLQTRNTIFLSGFFLLISSIIALFTTQRLTRPITRLTRAAERVAAGDLWIQAPEGRDEIGVLAGAFNTMTAELRQTLEGLEHRVAERTAEQAKASQQAQNRAKQLQTVSEVARAIATILDPDELLRRVTQLISERFGYYHVGIFLVDKNQEYAALQAANSEGGQRMLARSHRLKVGQKGIVGHVTSVGEARIALDVGEDAVYFDNPDLPYTRSEMALPLKVGERIIGALDVQSMEQSAFSEEDISLLSTLADQVAIAIENARLLNETQTTLVELQSLHRQYLREEYSEVVADRAKSGYQYDLGRFLPLPSSASQNIWSNFEDGAEIILNEGSDAAEESSLGLIAPIKVRGQVIGMMNLVEDQQNRQWDEEEISLIKAVADQVGLAIENARLIEQTQRRAEREHLVSEITTKLRASNDPQVILETATRELRQALRAKRAQVVIPPPIRHQPTDQPAPEDGNGDEPSPNGSDQPQT